MRLIVAFLVIFVFLLPLALADPRVGFYRRSCPRAESIVKAVVAKHFKSDKSVPAALLRMHFHDCFVRGCDASILIDSTSKKKSEKDAGPNKTVRGFDIIDEAKKNVEAACRGTVSCADIIALATRDAVALAGGPSYAVPTGRRDGLVSNPDDVDVPDPNFSVSQALQAFSAKNMNLNDMVTLLGAHTVGVAHCGFFSERINDPTMDRALAAKLMKICGSRSASNPSATAFLDQATPFTVDNQYYKQIRLKRGLLEIDQELANDGLSRGFVSAFASNSTLFRARFAEAMVKMGRIQVLVGKAGEIRQNCRAFNPKRRGRGFSI